MKKSAYSWASDALDTIARANWYREVRDIEGLPGPVVQLQGQEVINFASNDYLGLAGDRRLMEAAIEATERYGTGSTGSRLLSGHRPLHRELERAIANLKQTEDAIVFSSGYLANLGTIAAVVGKRDLILSDEYNHSSLKHGATLSGATVISFRHNDMEELTARLQQVRHEYRRCLITADSLFSMDGDLCPVPELLAIAETYDSMLLLDEAHATGVFGISGAGVVEHFQASGSELIQIGTLSKALGSLGGYAAGSATLIDYLRNRAPTWIYTTGLSPADTAAATKAIELVRSEPERRQHLWDNISYLQQQLASRCPQWQAIASDTPIICLPAATPEEALQVGQKLRDRQIFAPAIRPPTVPTSRIRLSLMATHDRQHLDCLVNALCDV